MAFNESMQQSGTAAHKRCQLGSNNNKQDLIHKTANQGAATEFKNQQQPHKQPDQWVSPPLGTQ